MTAPRSSSGTLRVQSRGGGPVWFGLWKTKVEGVWRQRQRRLAPAWLEAQPVVAGSSRPEDWRPRRGRPRDGALDERAAWAALRDAIEQDSGAVEAAARAKARGITFRELAHEWL